MSGWPGPKLLVAPFLWTSRSLDPAIDPVLLDLRDVVADVVDYVHVQRLRVLVEDLLERLA